jgi:hypothetical protein
LYAGKFGSDREKLERRIPCSSRGEDSTRGDPENPVKWTSKSTLKLCRALKEKGYEISQRSVCTLLWGLGYSLQANRKTNEGANHPDRDAQFSLINNKVQEFQKAKQPVISVDTKKKELNRTSLIQFYFCQLAWKTFDRPSHCCQSDC